jgi:hypothetical protein
VVLDDSAYTTQANLQTAARIQHFDISKSVQVCDNGETARQQDDVCASAAPASRKPKNR